VRRRSLSAVLLSAALAVPLTASAVAAQTPVTAGAGVPAASSGSGAVLAGTAAGVRLAPVAARSVAPAPSLNSRLLRASNAARARHGLRPLAPSPCPERYATGWSRALAARGTLGHQPMQPVLRSCRARAVAENVGFGNVTPEAMVDMWLGSPGHRANLLNPRYTHLGAGTTLSPSGRLYGVQVFVSL
jgi:uncharacterized protein YkwD